MRIDLHSHSTHSDGRESVETVFAEAAASNLQVLALTDHDTTAGWSEAQIAAEKCGVAFVPGIELTTTTHHGVSVHLLAYLPNGENLELQRAMAEVKESRGTRISRFIENLREGYPDLSHEAVLNGSDPADKAIGRPHIADALVSLGHFSDRTEAFSGPLNKNSEFYVPNDGIDTIKAIGLVRSAGGVAIMAHPLARASKEFVSSDRVRGHFLELIEAGIGGFEIHHREVGDAARQWMASLAAEFDLITTGSSDYHGLDGKPNRLGENLTEFRMLERIQESATGTTIRWV